VEIRFRFEHNSINSWKFKRFLLITVYERHRILLLLRREVLARTNNTGKNFFKISPLKVVDIQAIEDLFLKLSTMYYNIKQIIGKQFLNYIAVQNTLLSTRGKRCWATNIHSYVLVCYWSLLFYHVHCPCHRSS